MRWTRDAGLPTSLPASSTRLTNNTLTRSYTLIKIYINLTHDSCSLAILGNYSLAQDIRRYSIVGQRLNFNHLVKQSNKLWRLPQVATIFSRRCWQSPRRLAPPWCSSAMANMPSQADQKPPWMPSHFPGSQIKMKRHR